MSTNQTSTGLAFKKCEPPLARKETEVRPLQQLMFFKYILTKNASSEWRKNEIAIAFETSDNAGLFYSIHLADIF